MRSPLLFSTMALALALRLPADPAAGGILVYPDADTSFNPRVACIAPVDKPAGANAWRWRLIFVTSLRPLFNCTRVNGAGKSATTGGARRRTS